MINSLEFVDSDFVSMAAFGRAWRFTDPRYALLPRETLARIRPLSPAIARLLSSPAAALHVVASSAATVTIETAGTPEMPTDDVAVRNALDALGIPSTTQVIALWDSEDAVVTDWQTFVAYWADFCYPGSDDVTVWPVLASRDSWALCYDHEESFRFFAPAA